MGGCKSSNKDEGNDAINKELAEARKEKASEIKLLLLGAGESGKSTVAKQMKIIHNDGFSDDEYKTFVSVIHTNVYSSIKALLEALEKLEEPKIELADKKSKELLPQFEPTFVERITPELGKSMAALWKDEGMQAIYKRRHEYQLTDSTQYYLTEIERISAADYVPTQQDVLRSRQQTTGIIETEFTVDGSKFIIADVGGQRSERKKWMHCFEDVTAVLFVISLSGFDLTLYEDRVTNRMQEALQLFKETVTSKWFNNAAIILFMNKSDLFKIKLEEGKQLKTAFPDYTGDNSYESACEYVQEQFTSGVVDPVTKKLKEVYAHITCATDTSNVQKVFDAVKDSLLQQSLQASGFGL